MHSGTLQMAAVLLLGLCIAAGGAMCWQSEIDLDADAQFKRSVERVVADGVLRFRQLVFGLNGARGMYAAAGKSLQRSVFRAYVESRDLPKEFPGVRGFGRLQNDRLLNVNRPLGMRLSYGGDGHRVRSDDRPLPGREISLAAFRQRILKGDSRVGAHYGHRTYPYQLTAFDAAAVTQPRTHH